MPETRQPVMTLMFDARIRDMAAQLSLMEPGELDREGLKAVHAETRRLLQLPARDEETTA